MSCILVQEREYVIGRTITETLKTDSHVPGFVETKAAVIRENGRLKGRRTTLSGLLNCCVAVLHKGGTSGKGEQAQMRRLHT